MMQAKYRSLNVTHLIFRLSKFKNNFRTGSDSFKNTCVSLRTMILVWILCSLIMLPAPELTIKDLRLSTMDTLVPI